MFIGKRLIGNCLRLIFCTMSTLLLKGIKYTYIVGTKRPDEQVGGG